MNIPTAGRIVAVAEYLDTLTHDRPYKKTVPMDRAITEITERSGAWFDPQVVDSLLLALRGNPAVSNVLN